MQAYRNAFLQRHERFFALCVCVCVCMYMCLYESHVYVNICVHVYMYMYMHTYIHTYIRAKRQVTAEARIYILAYMLLAILGYMNAILGHMLLYMCVLPALLGQPFLRFYLMAEHRGCEGGTNVLVNTRTTVTNWYAYVWMYIYIYIYIHIFTHT